VHKTCEEIAVHKTRAGDHLGTLDEFLAVAAWSPRLHQGPPGVVLVLVQQQEKTQNQLPVRIVVLSPRAACRRRQWQQAPHRRPPGSSSSRSLSCLLSPRRAAMNSRGSSLADGGRHLLQLRGLLVVVAHEQGCRPRHCRSGALLLATHSTTPGAGS